MARVVKYAIAPSYGKLESFFRRNLDAVHTAARAQVTVEPVNDAKRWGIRAELTVIPACLFDNKELCVKSVGQE